MIDLNLKTILITTKITCLMAICLKLEAQISDIQVNQVGPLTTTPGTTVQYKIHVTNAGPSNASNVRVFYPTSSNVSFTAVTCVAGAGRGSSASCPTIVTIAGLQGAGLVIPSLPVGSAVTFTVTGTVGLNYGVISKTASATSANTDPTPGNNSSQVTTEIISPTCSPATYRLNAAATLAANTVAVNGGVMNLVYNLESGTAIPAIGSSFTIPVTYSDMININPSVDNRWNTVGSVNSSIFGWCVGFLPQTNDLAGGIYNSLPANNTSSKPSLTPNNSDHTFTTHISNGNIDQLGGFTISIGNYPTLPSNVKIVNQVFQTGTINNNTGSGGVVTAGFWTKPLIQTSILPNAGNASTVAIEMQPGQSYSYRYSAFSNGTDMPVHANVRGVMFLQNSTVTFGYVRPVINNIAPISQSLCVNQSATPIEVTVDEGLPVTYQWYRNTTNSNTGGTAISGETSSDYLPPTNTMGQSYYYAVATNAGCSTISAVASVSIGCTLPVEFADFIAQVKNTTVSLQWSTDWERNNMGFEIQRSPDATNWSAISFFNSKATDGNSYNKLSYQYQDYQPLSAVSFYRLKQVDKDGKYVYSKVRKIILNDVSRTLVYPNPAQNFVVVEGLVGNETISLYNSFGKKIKSEIVDRTSAEINISHLEPAMYIIRITNRHGEVINTRKIIKTR